MKCLLQLKIIKDDSAGETCEKLLVRKLPDNAMLELGLEVELPSADSEWAAGVTTSVDSAKLVEYRFKCYYCELDLDAEADLAGLPLLRAVEILLNTGWQKTDHFI